jgi:hypothetical protein
MTKRKLKNYLNDLNKEQIEEQVLDLYDRFKEVKGYYDFAFNPKEDKLLEESKFKIAKEYFPIGKRKAKLRRSVAQKIIKKCKTLQLDPQYIIEIMLYNIEIATTYTAEKSIKQDAFYKSMLKSFEEMLAYISLNGLIQDYISRIESIVSRIEEQKWFNYPAFTKELEDLVS